MGKGSKLTTNECEKTTENAASDRSQVLQPKQIKPEKVSKDSQSLSQQKSPQATVISPPVKNSGAKVLFDREVEAILLSDGFVDVNLLYSRLAGKIYPNDLVGFREIQNLNRIINNAISTYWHSQTIRTYSDLESFVLETINKLCKLSPPLTHFSKVGVGNKLI